MKDIGVFIRGLLPQLMNLLNSMRFILGLRKLYFEVPSAQVLCRAWMKLKEVAEKLATEGHYDGAIEVHLI